MPGIVAFWEKEAVSCEGILRKEFRIRPVKDFSPDDLDAAFGPDWRRARPYASHVLETRFIRCGVDEGWKPDNAANEYDEALEYIDGHATAVDPKLQRLYDKRSAYAAEQKQKEEDERVKASAAEDRRYHQKRSEAAFEKLSKSEKDGPIAEQWNDFARRHGAEENALDRIRNDATWKSLYDDAMAAETVPSKRKAIRAFLAYSKKHGLERADEPAGRRGALALVAAGALVLYLLSRKLKPATPPAPKALSAAEEEGW